MTEEDKPKGEKRIPINPKPSHEDYVRKEKDIPPRNTKIK